MERLLVEFRIQHSRSRRGQPDFSTRSRHWRRLFGGCLLVKWNALDLRLTGAEIVVAGEDAQAAALLGAARKLPYATSIVLHAPHADALPADHPARAKLSAVAQSAAFICRGQSCSLPVTQPDALNELM